MTVAALGHDGSFTEDDFKLRVNADLSNNLGNLLNRTLSMVGKYFNGEVPCYAGMEEAQSALQNNAESERRLHFDKIRAAYETMDFPQAAALSLELVDIANRAINDKEPWTLFKENRLDELAALMVNVLETVRQVAILLSPMIPTLSNGIWSQLGYENALVKNALEATDCHTERRSQRFEPLVLWPALWENPLPAGQVLKPQGPVLPRLDSELAGADKQKKANGAQKTS
jgi:methionyl-tRNA synthetase